MHIGLHTLIDIHNICTLIDIIFENVYGAVENSIFLFCHNISYITNKTLYGTIIII